MPCSHCAHCRAQSSPAAMTLSGPPQMSNQADANLPFYREFAAAYGRARELKLRPRQALMARNPWLTASQCNTYLKRARDLGLVQTPPRQTATQAVGRVAAPVAEPAPVQQPATPPLARAARGGGRAKRGAADWTPRQSEDVWLADSVVLRCANQRRLGQPLTLELLQAAAPGKLTDAQARAVLDWAVSTEEATRADDGVSVHPTMDF